MAQKIKKVVSRKNLPTRLPLFHTLVAFLLLDRFDAPGWLWGAIGVLYFFLWVGAIGSICSEKSINLWENE